MYNGVLLKDGELFNAAENPSKFKFSHEDEGKNSFNISCNKGTLYKVQRFQQHQTNQNQNDNNNSKSKDELESLDISYDEIDIDRNGKIEDDKSQGILFLKFLKQIIEIKFLSD
jgi:hypothetical protein